MCKDKETVQMALSKYLWIGKIKEQKTYLCKYFSKCRYFKIIFWNNIIL